MNLIDEAGTGRATDLAFGNLLAEKLHYWDANNRNCIYDLVVQRRMAKVNSSSFQSTYLGTRKAMGLASFQPPLLPPKFSIQMCDDERCQNSRSSVDGSRLQHKSADRANLKPLTNYILLEANFILDCNFCSLVSHSYVLKDLVQLFHLWLSKLSLFSGSNSGSGARSCFATIGYKRSQCQASSLNVVSSLDYGRLDSHQSLRYVD